MMCSYGGVTASGLLLLHQLSGSRDSSVGIATGLWAGRLRCRSLSPGGIKNFLFCTSSRPALGLTQPPVQWVRGGSLSGGKAVGA
jgi:hypothetical protein